MSYIRITHSVWLYFRPHIILYRRIGYKNMVCMELIWNWKHWEWDVFSGLLKDENKLLTLLFK